MAPGAPAGPRHPSLDRPLREAAGGHPGGPGSPAAGEFPTHTAVPPQHPVKSPVPAYPTEPESPGARGSAPGAGSPRDARRGRSYPGTPTRCRSPTRDAGPGPFPPGQVRAERAPGATDARDHDRCSMQGWESPPAGLLPTLPDRRPAIGSDPTKGSKSQHPYTFEGVPVAPGEPACYR